MVTGPGPNATGPIRCDGNAGAPDMIVEKVLMGSDVMDRLLFAFR